MGDLFDLQFLPTLKGKEGGGKFTNNPADRGGPTRWGVTAAKLGEWRGLGRPATAAEVAALTEAEADQIYRAEFYVKPGFDKVTAVFPQVAYELIDTGVNMGAKVAATFLQRALNVLNRCQLDWPDLQVDSVIGARTVSALLALRSKRGGEGEVVLLKALNCLQGAHYIELAEAREANETFEYGWLAQRVGLPA